MLEGVKRERQGQDMKQKKKKNNHRLRSCLSILCAMVILYTTILNVPGIWASDVSGGEDIQNIFESDTSGNQESVSEPEPDEQGFSSGPDSNEPGSGEQDLNEQGISDQNTNEPQQTGGDNTAFSDDQNLPYSENEDIWRQSVSGASLTGDYARDLVAVAHTQLGVTENMTNVLDGCYYSRYGEWYNEGTTYNEWSAMFVSFCAQYANIPTIYLPKAQSVSQWAGTLGGMYGLVKEGYTPKAGDLIFFHTNEYADGNTQIQTGDPAHVGIVTSADDTYVYTIEGNSQAAVKTQWYPLADEKIYAYLDMDTVKKAAGLIQEEPQPEKVITSEQEGIQQEEIITSKPEKEEQQKEETENPEEKEKDIEDEENKDQEDATQKRYVEIISDEVNLRAAASDSEDSEIIDTVNTGTVLELTAEITNPDDNTLWYEVIYEREEMESVTAYVRSDYAKIKETEKEGEEEITRYDYEGDGVQVKVILTDPADLPDDAQLVVTPVEISQETEDKIAENAIAEQKAIKNIRAYDIKFLREGEEIQPGSTVKVEILFLNEEPAGDADVYHVDEEKVENMGGSVNADGNVEFETEHFSTYVIVNNGTNKVEVTLEHCENNSTQKIYADTVKTLNVGAKIPDYRLTENYTVERVVIVENDQEKSVDNLHEIRVVKDTTVRIYYNAIEKSSQGSMSLYDYQIKPGNGGKSINDNSHYPNGSPINNRMTMGDAGTNGTGYNVINADGKWANSYYGGSSNDCITKGLVTGLDANGDVLWSVDQPGFFTDSNCGLNEGKQKYTNYKLNFKQVGNQYTLTGVTRPDGTIANAGADFYPLASDGVSRVWDNDGKNGNYYFGIRYDVEFQLGDYIGSLNYEFTGDDDLWVLLDDKVVIDVGGIHDALTDSTDLWKDLGYENGRRPMTDAEKNKTHRITVLYMERGAGASNCAMKFTIPDARFVDVTNVPLADITFKKVNSERQGISGAKFKLVNDEGGETYSLMTSDVNGDITFNDLKEGTYTLTETMAPDGYVIQKENYKVKVTVSGDTAIAKLYKADGVTEVEANQIINYTETEEAEKNLTSSKTVEVDNYENRTYRINLNAATTGHEAGTDAKGASVVMVLDASESMNDYISGTQKIEALKTAAKSFVDRLSQASKESEISIIWYSGSEGEESNLTTIRQFTQLSETGVTTLKSSIENPTRAINGGTPMGVALNAAYNQLSHARYQKNKYVLFMTDGMPGYWGYDSRYPYQDHNNKDCMVANNAVNYANKIKDSNDGKAILYTVGVGLNNQETFYWKEGHSATSSNYEYHMQKSYYNNRYSFDHISMTGSAFLSAKIATQPNSGKTYAFTTNNLSDLTGIFDDIAGSIGDLFTVQPEKIVDVIDARFKLTEESKISLLQLNENENTGYVSISENADGTTTITWTGNAAKIGNAEAETDKGWHVNFLIQAKDDFIGGNSIPTNGVASGIYLENNEVQKFQQPSVNVRLLSLEIDNTEETVYKGDTISPASEVPKLADEVVIKELVVNSEGKTVTTRTGIPTGTNLPTLTEEQKKQLINGEVTLGEINSDGTYPYEYKYPETQDAVGYFTYTYKLSESPGGNWADHKAETAGNGLEVYELTVTYHPYDLTTRNGMIVLQDITVPTEKGGTEVTYENIEPVTGTHTVNVIEGKIEIIKVINEDEKSDDQTFTFTVKKMSDTNSDQPEKDSTGQDITYPVTIEIKKDQTTASGTVDHLPRGTYVVSENDVSGYAVQSVMVKVEGSEDENITDCWYEQKESDATAVFGLGYSKEITAGGVKKDVINKNPKKYIGGGVLGVVIFTNEKITGDWGIQKVDSSDSNIKLSGAIFKLEGSDDNEPKETYYGKSTDTGLVIWYRDDSCTEENAVSTTEISKGKYELTEMKAPAGYALSTEVWTIIVTKEGKMKSVTSASDIAIEQETLESSECTLYRFKNTKLYNLPNSGGPGIYMFTISGVAFIATALLLFIRNKRKEEEAGIRL